MSNMDKKNKLVIVALIMMSIKSVLNTSALIVLPNILDNIINIFTILLLFPKIISNKYHQKEFIFILISGGLCLWIGLKLNELILFCSFLTILAIKDIKFTSVVKTLNRSKLMVVIFHVLLFLASFLLEEINLVSGYTLSGERRYSFFFENPNGFAGLMFWILAEGIFLLYAEKKEKKKKILYLIFFSLISIFIYKMTLSRTFFLNVILLYLLLFIGKFKKIRVLLIKVSKFILPLMMIFSIGLSLKYNNYENLFLTLDSFLSRRISLGHLALNIYGINLFPNSVNYSQIVGIPNIYYMKLTIDSIYIRFAISYGMIIFLILAYLIYKFVKNSESKNRNIIFYIFIIMYAINGFTENYMINAYFSFPLLFISKAFFPEGDV